MVRFDDKSFTIEIYTGNNPIEDFQTLQTEIAYVFSILTSETMPDQGLYHLANLLMNMQPSWEVAKKMTE